MTENVFAHGHEASDLRAQRYDLVTGFEVLEHLEDPVGALSEVAAVSDRLLVTTQMLPDPTPHPTQWWYYALSTGQHITFYTPRSLDLLAERLGFDGVVTGSFVHLLHRGPVSRVARALVARPALAFGAGLLSTVLDRRHSLLPADLQVLERSAS
jgi:hypothetical protein